MAKGRLVFDGEPKALSDSLARDIYGFEANEVMDTSATVTPVPTNEALAGAAAG
jgi:hypothetical protein